MATTASSNDRNTYYTEVHSFFKLRWFIFKFNNNDISSL